MPRPTDDKKGSTIILRINKETRKYLEKKAQGETLSSYVRRMIVKEKDGLQDNVIQNKTVSEADKKIEEDAVVFKLSAEELKLKLIEAVDSGKLMYENGEFTGVGEVDTSRFSGRCKELGMNPQETIDKITQRLG